MTVPLFVRNHRAAMLATTFAALVVLTGCTPTDTTVALSCGTNTVIHTETSADSVKAGESVTTTIDLPDFSEGPIIVAQGSATYRFPLPANVTVETATITPGPNSPRWTAQITDAELVLSFTMPFKVPTLFAGVPAVAVTTRVPADTTAPALEWRTYSQSRLITNEMGFGIDQTCTPVDPTQVIARIAILSLG